MKPHQSKSLKDQVIVITGASSGIGLVTARRAAELGSTLVLAGRNGEALGKVVEEIISRGGKATHVVADVANRDDVQRIADTAVSTFGGFDTWVNNAGVSVYGRIEDVALEDHKRLVDTNFWGVVNGSLAALEHLKHRGGTLINVGSALSDRAIPLQGMYCASKHAVKGFTDALRMEIEEADYPVRVTLIKPSAIDTPYKQHAKNYLDADPENPPPVYAPDVVAGAILHAAQHSVRDIIIGGGGKIMSLAGHTMPRLLDRIMELTMFKLQKSSRPPRPREDHALDTPMQDLEERGGYDGHVAESSLYTKASLHPLLVSGLILAAGVTAATIANAVAARRRRTKAPSWQRAAHRMAEYFQR